MDGGEGLPGPPNENCKGLNVEQQIDSGVLGSGASVRSMLSDMEMLFTEKFGTPSSPPPVFMGSQQLTRA